MNKQVKVALSVVRSLISGSSDEARQIEADDKDTRAAVCKELLAAMSLETDQAAVSDANSEGRSQQQSTLQRERSRQLFMELGYFDEAVQDLRAADSAGERAAAARALGLVGNNRATVHLVAAMFDDDAEVRNAAGEALALVENPTYSDSSTAVNAESPRL